MSSPRPSTASTPGGDGHPSTLTASELRIAEATASIVLKAIESRLRPAELISAQALADLLGVRRETVYRQAEELGGVRVGGAWRFDPSAATGLTSRRPSTPEPRRDKPKPATRSRRRKGASGDLLRIGPKSKGGKRA